MTPSDTGGEGSAPRPSGPTGGAPKMWLSDLSIKQPVFITMLALAVIVVGVISYSRIGLDLFPDVALPVAVVRTVYPGADPQEVERSVTKPIEDAVASLNGVESVRSTSMDSVSLVIVEFKLEMDGKQAAEDVRTRVNTIRNALPADVKEPVIERFDPSASPILSLAITDHSGRRSAEQLRSMADDVLKPRLERVPGVAAVDVSGGRVREVHVDLKLAQLQAYSIPPQMVLQAIRTENLDVPAGRAEDGRSEELIRTAGEVESLDQLGEVPITGSAAAEASAMGAAGGPGGAAASPVAATLKLKDIANVSEGDAEVRRISRLDGNESVVAEVRKQSGTNTVQVSDAVKAELRQLGQEYPDVSFAVAFDQSTYTRESVQDIQLSLVLGAILAAVVVLLFFRDLRNTLVTIAGLPVILLGTAAVLHFLGLTFNVITMLALSLSIGMLIDDAIVVRENIFRHMEQGEEPRVAAGRGTAEIALAVVAVTSTIVAVFLPIAFTEGLAGKFLRDFGITVAVAVIISLIEAFTLAPMLSAYFFKRLDPQRGNGHHGGRFERAFEQLNSGYRAMLAWSLGHRLVIVAVGMVVLAATAAVVPMMVFAFIPEADQGEFGVSIELPPGARVEDTDRVARAAEQVLQADAAVEHVFTAVGSSDGAVDKATLAIKLHQRGHTVATMERLRPELQRALAGTKFSVDKESIISILGGGAVMGALTGRPIQFAVEGEDFQALDKASADLVARLRQIPGAVDVDRSIKPGKPERAIVLDRAKATDLGVTTALVGSTVRTLVNGETAGSYRAGDKDVDIVVRLGEADRVSPADMLRLPVVTQRGAQVPLSAVASLVPSTQPNQIERQNRQRQVIVGAGYLGRNSGAVLAAARSEAAEMPLPEGVSIKVTGEAEYMDEMLSSLTLALVLAVFFVYMILASQFGSFVHPFTIMLALPFSAIGALVSLLVGGFDFDILAMIGIILLVGLVTKNSILLVEFVNQLRRRGLDTRQAILEAGPIRLRPILMTTLAMIFGMIPVAAGVGAGAELRQPMGVSVIGGLITSTLLTLVVVPVVYSLVDDLTRLLTRRHGAPAAAAQLPVPPEGRRGGRRLTPRRVVLYATALMLAMAITAAGLYAATTPTIMDDIAAMRLPTIPPRAASTVTPGAADGLAAVDQTPAPAEQTPAPATPTPLATPVATPASSPTPTRQVTPPAPVRVRIANTGGLGAYIRESPQAGAKRIIALPEGTALERLGESAESGGRVWIKVRDAKGTVGWMPKEYLTAVATQSVGEAGQRR